MNQNNKHYNRYYDFVLNKICVTQAEEIVYNIIHDLSDRRGIKHEFNNIDADIQEELVDTWINIVNKALQRAKRTLKELTKDDMILIDHDQFGHVECKVIGNNPDTLDGSISLEMQQGNYPGTIVNTLLVLPYTHRYLMNWTLI